MAWRNIQYHKNNGKYGAKKATVDGIVFDSRKEARRYSELKILEKAGEIENLRRQVKFLLIPSQYEESEEVFKKGPRKGQKKQGKLLEKEVAYYADFVYEKNGQTLVEDTKGFRTTDYIIKRKLMLWIFGIKILEV